jgi:HSP20 family protein
MYCGRTHQNYPSKLKSRWFPRTWSVFEGLRRDIDCLFDDVGGGLWRNPLRRSTVDMMPFWGRELTLPAVPAVDVSDIEKAYEIAAELPGIDEKNIEVKVSNGILTIRGEKQEEKEEKRKTITLGNGIPGRLSAAFRSPDGVDTDKIEAGFKKGVLTVTLPKKPEIQQAAKTISVKAA